jgi:hypothetical protein
MAHSDVAPKCNEIVSDVCSRYIDKPIILNVFRAHVVEAIVIRALGSTYRLTDGWEGWDVEHTETGWRLEIKQSAAKQSWHVDDVVTKRAVFDIAPRTGEYRDQIWVAYDSPKRAANSYLFAWHQTVGMECDHRDALQWKFYLLDARLLPVGQKTISLESIRRLTGREISWSGLGAVCEQIRIGEVPDNSVA